MLPMLLKGGIEQPDCPEQGKQSAQILLQANPSNAGQQIAEGYPRKPDLAPGMLRLATCRDAGDAPLQMMRAIKQRCK